MLDGCNAPNHFSDTDVPPGLLIIRRLAGVLTLPSGIGEVVEPLTAAVAAGASGKVVKTATAAVAADACDHPLRTAAARR